MPVNGIGGGDPGRDEGNGRRSLRGNTKTSGSRKAKSKQKPERGPRKSLTLTVTKEILEAEKTALLAEKHVQLEALLDKHDTLVSIFKFASVPLN
jgi:hypothetical protein